MKLSPAQMETIRYQFDSFCRKVLREKSRDIERQRKRRAEKEVCFSAISEQQLAQFYVLDEYPSENTYFGVLDYRIAIKDERLADAIASLPGEKRDILLLSYFLGMNDREIADVMKIIKRTVQRRRVSSIQGIRSRLEAGKDEHNEEW